jgi:hypothetical protein
MVSHPTKQPTNQPTNQTKPNPTQPNREERNSKVHYDVHKNFLLDPIFSQMNPVHTPTTCLLKIHFNTIPDEGQQIFLRLNVISPSNLW